MQQVWRAGGAGWAPRQRHRRGSQAQQAALAGIGLRRGWCRSGVLLRSFRSRVLVQRGLAPALPYSACQKPAMLRCNAPPKAPAAAVPSHLRRCCIGADQQVDHLLYAGSAALRRQLLHQLLHLQCRELALLIELHRHGGSKEGSSTWVCTGGGSGGGTCYPPPHCTVAGGGLSANSTQRQWRVWEPSQPAASKHRQLGGGCGQLCRDPDPSEALSSRTLSAMFLVTYWGSVVWLAILSATKIWPLGSCSRTCSRKPPDALKSQAPCIATCPVSATRRKRSSPVLPPHPPPC